MQLNIDIETYSDQILKYVGLYRYADSEVFDVLLFAYSFDGGETQILDLTEGALPEWMITYLYDPRVVKVAYNAAFEWWCLSTYLCRLGYAMLDVTQWRCTQVQALYHGLPFSLDGVGKALNLAADKQKLTTGSALIRYFCVPCKPTKANNLRMRNLPGHDRGKWELFKTYCKGDVVAEMAIAAVLNPIPEHLWQEFHTDILQNARGIAVDLPVVQGAVAIDLQIKKETLEDSQRISGLSNPNSDKQLIEWLNREHPLLHITSVDKANREALLARVDLSDRARRMLENADTLGKSSCAKFHTMLGAVCRDGRVRGNFQYYGANRTGREAGRLVQIQNLPRTYIKDVETAKTVIRRGKRQDMQFFFDDVPGTLSQMIRTCLVPAEGHLFMDADFSAIEARVLAWLAGEEWVLEVFRTHGKIYEENAARMFKVPLDTIVKGHPNYKLRDSGKVAQLALGYNGGVGAVENMDKGGQIAPEDRPNIVKLWREANPNIVRYWKQVEQAVRTVLETGREATVGVIQFRWVFDRGSNAYLGICLPSGRTLHYARPHIGTDAFGKTNCICYYEEQSKQWRLSSTYGGKLVENITQAVARDLLFYSLMNLEAAGYEVVFHVHDEVVVEREKGAIDEAQFYAIMGTAPPWARGLPLASDGWTGAYYTKD